jgi:predicted O-methyltransferase YrrM
VSVHAQGAGGLGPLTWSTGAMTAAGLTAVCAEVGARERPTVVECGSGYSSLRLAEVVHARAGSLISLEHDAAWAARVEDALAAAGLAETARIVRAPLERHPLGRDGLPWYAERAVGTLPRRIDVLLVDGPPAFEPGAGLSRYPALPALAERLAPDAVVVLDDIDRPGELEVLKAWEHDTGSRFQIRAAARIALGQVGFGLHLGG